jgi:hypothetical protein
MAFGKTTGCLILAAALSASAAQFPVRHEHLRKGCSGVLTVDENEIRFSGAKKHAWNWKYRDIQQLTLSPTRIRILSYKDSSIRLGADMEFNFTGKLPAEELYRQWSAKLDQRFVAALSQGAQGDAQGDAVSGQSFAVKRLALITGSEGMLTFAAETIVYATPSKDQSRTWRYSDVKTIASSGAFQLTVTTLETQFNFQLKQPITEAGYNELWLQIEKKNGRIQ